MVGELWIFGDVAHRQQIPRIEKYIEFVYARLSAPREFGRFWRDLAEASSWWPAQPYEVSRSAPWRVMYCRRDGGLPGSPYLQIKLKALMRQAPKKRSAMAFGPSASFMKSQLKLCQQS